MPCLPLAASTAGPYVDGALLQFFVNEARSFLPFFVELSELLSTFTRVLLDHF